MITALCPRRYTIFSSSTRTATTRGTFPAAVNCTCGLPSTKGEGHEAPGGPGFENREHDRAYERTDRDVGDGGRRSRGFVDRGAGLQGVLSRNGGGGPREKRDTG